MASTCRECKICRRCQQQWRAGCASCRRCRVCEDERATLWRRVSAPFLLPQGLAGHRCRWQCVDFDLAGCLDCGKIHRCEIGVCPVSEEEDSMVCTITGNCVHTKRFSKDEFMDNVVMEDVREFGEHARAFIEIDEVQERIHWILQSEVARQSFIQERARMEQKHKHLMWKILKEIKMRNEIPNLCWVITHILHATNKIRVCSVTFQDDLRGLITSRCSHYIRRFLNMLSQRFGVAMSTVKKGTLVIGTLYLMRMGIYMHNVILLPRVPQLQLLLPIETHLKSYFKVKCKSITEVENLIKMCIRGLTVNDIDKMGFMMTDNGM